MGCKPENWPHCKCTPKFQNNGMVNNIDLGSRNVGSASTSANSSSSSRQSTSTFVFFVFLSTSDGLITQIHTGFFFLICRTNCTAKINMAHSFLLCVCFFQDNNTRCYVIGGLSLRSTTHRVGEFAAKPTTQLAVQRPSAPTISVVMLQILINIYTVLRLVVLRVIK